MGRRARRPCRAARRNPQGTTEPLPPAPAVNPLLRMSPISGAARLPPWRKPAACLSFYGQTVVALSRLALQPGRLRLTSLDAPPGADLRQCAADRGADRLPDRYRHGLSGRRPAAPLRRGDLHGRPAGHLGAARDRHSADRGGGRRPLRQRLHGRDRNDEGQRGGRCAQDPGPGSARGPGPAAPARADDRAAAARLLRRHHGPLRRRPDVRVRARHLTEPVPRSARARRSGHERSGWASSRRRCSPSSSRWSPATRV